MLTKQVGDSKVAMTYNAANQLTSMSGKGGQITYRYDKNGNLTSKQLGGKKDTYTYDVQDKLTAFAGYDGYRQEYSYNALGELSERAVSGNGDRVLLEDSVLNGTALSSFSKSDERTVTRYIYDSAMSVPQVLVESTNGNDTLYDYGLERLARHKGGEKTQYVYDAGGSVVQTVTADLVNTYSYTPFGEQLGTAVSGFTYNGEYYDAATGMLNLRARQYEPSMMRFNQQDLIRGSLGDIVSLNRYAYCHNNPLSFSDPTGMSILSKLSSAVKSTAKAVKSTAKAVGAKVVSTAAKVTKTVAKTVSKVSTTVAKVSSTVSKVATKVATNSNSKIVKSIANSVAKTANKVTTVANKVTATADKVAELSDQIAKTYDKIAEDAWADAKENFASAAKDFNAAAKEAKEQLQCVAEKAGDVIVSAATTAWDYCKQNPMEIVHGALDVIGMLPGVGNIADGINAAIYLAEGDYVNAALSAVSLIPFGGALAALGKVASKSDNLVKMAVKHGDEAIDAVQGIIKHADKADEAAEVVEGLMKHGDGAAKKAGDCIDGFCFIAGTLVLTANGYKNIEDVEVGDKVIATNPETGKTEIKEVKRTFENKTFELLHLTVNGEVITSTPGHKYYAPEKGWTSAIDLAEGDLLQLVNGEYVVVECVQHEILEEPVTIYNFEVEDFHTYYVGEQSVLVHNRDCTKTYYHVTTADNAKKNNGIRAIN